MKIKAYNERENKLIEMEANNIKDIAEKMNISLKEVIVIKNNELVTEDSKIKDNDELKFLSVISGG